VWGLSVGEQMDAFGQICHAFKKKIYLMPLRWIGFWLVLPLLMLH
jgi:hypothetical protein